MRNLRRFAVGVALATVWAGSALPALAAESGTVDAQVTVATPCILVDPPSLDFGSVPFRSPTNPILFAQQHIDLTNCGAGQEDLFGRGTDATTGGNPVWTLSPYGPCSGILNEYSFRSINNTDSQHPVALTTSNQLLDIVSSPL